MYADKVDVSTFTLFLAILCAKDRVTEFLGSSQQKLSVFTFFHKNPKSMEKQTVFYVQGELQNGTSLHEPTAFTKKESAEEKRSEFERENPNGFFWITELNIV